MSHGNQNEIFRRNVSDAQNNHDTVNVSCEAPDNVGHNHVCTEFPDNPRPQKIFCKHYYQSLITNIIFDENGKEDGLEKYLCMGYQYPTSKEDHEKMMLWCNTKTMENGEFEKGTVGTKGKGSNILMYHMADKTSIFSRNKDTWTTRIWETKKHAQKAKEEADKNIQDQMPINHIGTMYTTIYENKKWGEEWGGNCVFKSFYTKIKKVCEQNMIPTPQTFILLKLVFERALSTASC